MSRARHLAWAASAVLHLSAAAAVLTALPPPQPEILPVMLLDMPEPLAPEPAESVTEAAAPPPMAEAPPEPPPEPEPPLAETPPPPDPPPLAEVEPTPPPEPQPPPAEVAELPPPPPPPPVVRPPTPPRRHVQPRPAPPSPAAPSLVEAPVPVPAAPAAPAAVAAAPSPSYAALLLRALERHRHYPEEARWRRIQGVALLRFRMARDGTVIGYRIERSAGDASLDQAVQAMIQNASPLPAPPDDLPGNPVELTVPVRFTLR